MVRRRDEHKTESTSSVVVYSRVSTEDQAREGISLDVQRSRCLDYARALGLEVVHTFEDAGKSGRSLRGRPGVLAAIETAIEHRASLLVYALDRLTRSVRDLGELLELVSQGRLELVSVTDSLNTRTAAGRLVVHVLGAVSQWQREAGNERVRDALAHARESGARLGVLPLGLRRGSARDREGRLVVELDPAGVELRAKVLAVAELYRFDGRGRWFRCGAASYRRGALGAIARRLNKAGVTTLRGKPWRAETVRRVLSAVTE